MTRFVAAVVTTLALLFSPHAASAKTYVMKFGTVAPDGTPWAKLLQEFKAKVEAATGGKIKIRLFLNGIKGAELRLVRDLADGDLQGVGASAGAYASIVKEVSAFEAPYLFRSPKEADYVIDLKVRKLLRKYFRQRGLIYGFPNENGFRHFGYRGDSPIKQWTDLKGVEMRSQPNWVHRKMWESWKAIPKAIPMTEVTTNLKTKAIKGFDNSLIIMYAAGWYKHVNHVTISAHMYQPAFICYNAKWFEALPAKFQKILLDEGDKLVRRGRVMVRALNPTWLAQIKKQRGMTVTVLSKGARRAFESRSKQVHSSYSGGARVLLDAIVSGVKEYRRRFGG